MAGIVNRGRNLGGGEQGVRCLHASKLYGQKIAKWLMGRLCGGPGVFSGFLVRPEAGRGEEVAPAFLSTHCWYLAAIINPI
jgi:hypothetical protein